MLFMEEISASYDKGKFWLCVRWMLKLRNLSDVPCDIKPELCRMNQK